MQSTLSFTTPPNSTSLKNRKAGYAAVLFAASLIFSVGASADGDPDELFEADGTPILDRSGTAVESVSLGAAAEETAPLTGRQRAASIASRVANALKPASTVESLAHDRLSGYVSDKAFSLEYERSTEKYGVEAGRIDAGFLFTETRDLVFQLGFAIDAPVTLASSFRLSFGARSYIILQGAENNDAFAIALGAEAAYNLPSKRLPLELNASLYFAPDITTFGQGERVFDGRFDVILPVRSSFDVFIGYRFFRLDLRPGDIDLDDEIHGGLRYTFR